ncbi:MAG: hypothetical protein IKX88_07890, partial [Thermoguttaceae bacterium]|nr:hypothetical protein [Thermoguttaceae bacterium]
MKQTEVFTFSSLKISNLEIKQAGTSQTSLRNTVNSNYTRKYERITINVHMVKRRIEKPIG